VRFTFEGEVFEWRGPAPHHFVAVTDSINHDINQIAAGLSYGWGAIPVTVILGDTSWTTSIFPKAGKYIVPLKKSVREAESIQLGDMVTLQLQV